MFYLLSLLVFNRPSGQDAGITHAIFQHHFEAGRHIFTEAI
ncbi:hypothetical protein SNOG_11461 [Parastagonospora nodorum SN15]|uniref:Uncharacterized protein n=1 Tax=Phaeosphaeria nodorum (strain SN15 / ATCC MYA-4574 / FGSC 10173) TaxID=321614 RepID=Q0U9V3_PHANO|nr:hypothetical protein SNOG_11461 [Parastagonospora nodorum SN15]EAT81169.1 hypothetical protein SNOG_11461 [Parastagonospora nodorum SN15]